MSMAEAIVHDQIDMQIRDWLADQVENRGGKISKIASLAGIGRSPLSLFYNGHRPLSPESKEKLMALITSSGTVIGEKSCDEATDDNQPPTTEPQRHINPVPSHYAAAQDNKARSEMLTTEDFRQVIGLCSMCMDDAEIGIVIGPAGSGKTTALQEYCKRESGAVYIRADITMSAKELLVEIGGGLGIELFGSRRNMVRQIVIRLKNDPALIIIDEADLLVSRESVKKLEIVRSIWDEAHMGLVLAGPPNLATYLVKGPGGRENLSQFYSRVRRAYYMKGVNREEAMGFLAGISIDKDAAKYLITAAVSKANGGLRRFSRLLQNSLDLAESGETITMAIVKEADSLLVSPRSLGLEF